MSYIIILHQVSSFSQANLATSLLGRFRFPRWRKFWTRDITSSCVVWRHAFKLKFRRWKQTWKQRFWGVAMTSHSDVHVQVNTYLNLPIREVKIDVYLNGNMWMRRHDHSFEANLKRSLSKFELCLNVWRHIKQKLMMSHVQNPRQHRNIYPSLFWCTGKDLCIFGLHCLRVSRMCR